MTAHAPASGSGWRLLLGRRHRGAMIVLAGGVALYATNVFLTTSLLPSAIGAIGGAEFYAWATTVFLLASVVTSVLVSRLLGAAGAGGAYAVALGAFVAGTLVCAVAPSMPMLLAGRAAQGAGGGLLAGLGYALIRSTLPAALWARGTALVSAMWGVGTFLGPALGGMFAELASWRWAFVALALAASAVAVLVPRVLSGERGTGERERFPLTSLLLVSAAASVVSVAGLFADPVVGAGGVVLGLLLLAAFLVHERKSRAGVLPAVAFTAASRLRWIYLTIAILAVGSTAETFVPLFGQRLSGLGPLAAGFLGAAVAAGWTLGEIPSAGVNRPLWIRWIVIGGPVVLGAGLAVAACTQRSGAGGLALATWAFAMVLAGAGIGMAWPHLAAAAMGDPSGETGHDEVDTEGDKASAAINTVQLLANAFGAALTGVLVNAGGSDTALSARYLFGGFAVLAFGGLGTATLAMRRSRRPVCRASRG